MNESPMGTLRRHVAAEAVHDAGAAATTCTEGGSYENVALGLRFEGRDMVELQYAASWDTIRYMKATYLWEHPFGDFVMQCGRISGSAANEVFGRRSNAGPLDFAFTAVISFRDGATTAERVFYDLDDLCRQAGLDQVAVWAAAGELRDRLNAPPE